MQFTEKRDEALHYLNNTNEHLFITGNAGTGKTTLINEYVSKTRRNVACVAPTGTAALNCKGQTIHSFFRFRVGAITIDKMKNLNYDFKLKKMFDAIDDIIIDEVSMVRADLMDNIALFFKKNYPQSKKPFGGKRIIMVGDLDQLPPVVSSEEETKMINKRYGGNEFFFAAQVWRETQFRIIKLTKVYRQSDPVFVDLLNRIKNNLSGQADIDFLNDTCYGKGISVNNGIVLAASNKIADNINEKMLKRLESQESVFEGVKEGKFNISACPADEVVRLKVGCRVMILSNDGNKPRLYVNGSVGELIEIVEDAIKPPAFGSNPNDIDITETGTKLVVKLDTGDTVDIFQKVFENIEYTYDSETDKIASEVTGTFTQFPIKAAYAMTIHKSQGKTFDKIIVDLGRGSFAHGQLYVALSRCTSLEGITLRVPVNITDLIYNQTILDFNEYMNKL